MQPQRLIRESGIARNASESAYPHLWNGLVGWWCPSANPRGGSVLYDHSQYRRNGTLTNMDPATDWVASGTGLSLDFDGTDDYVLISSSRSLVAGSSNFTISTWFFFPSETSATSGGRAIYCERGTSGNGILKLDSLAWFAGYTVLFLTYRNDSGNLTQTQFETSVDHRGAWKQAAITFKDGNTFRLYIDGVEKTSLNWPHNNTLTTANQTWLARDPADGNSKFVGRLDDTRIYNRTLTSSEIRLLYTGGRGIGLQRRQSRTYFSFEEVSGVTGTLSATLGAATLSSSGTVAAGASGSLTSAMGAATLSSSGTVANGAEGTLTVTLASASVSSSGTVAAGASGSVTSTLDAATLSASGTVADGLIATLSKTLGTATLSASGTLTDGLTGSLTKTLDAATLSASGSETASPSGSLSATLGAATVSSSATLANGETGSLAKTLDAATLSSSGTLAAGAIGSVTKTLDGCTVSSTGSFSAGLTAQLNVALASATVSSSGAVANGATGALSVQLASASLAASGTLITPSTGKVFWVRVNGVWKETTPFVKASGAWKQATPWVKVGGEWK